MDVRVAARCEWTESDVRLSVVLCIVAFRKAASKGLHVPENVASQPGPSLVPLGYCEAVVSVAEDIYGVYRGKRLTD